VEGLKYEGVNIYDMACRTFSKNRTGLTQVAYEQIPISVGSLRRKVEGIYSFIDLERAEIDESTSRRNAESRKQST